MKNKLILLLLALLGFSGCNKDDSHTLVCEYGVPTSRFTIKGRVTDVSGTPVEGIRVTPLAAWYYDPQAPDKEPSYKDPLYPDTPVLTNEAGTFELSNSCFGFTHFRVSLDVDDIDGTENGGQFESREVIVSIGPEEMVEPGRWVSGYLKQADDIVITKTEE